MNHPNGRDANVRTQGYFSFHGIDGMDGMDGMDAMDGMDGWIDGWMDGWIISLGYRFSLYSHIFFFRAPFCNFFSFF